MRGQNEATVLVDAQHPRDLFGNNSFYGIAKAFNQRAIEV